jgi:C4-dicarboxylate-specific signal transduction histidine kinase
MEDFTHKSSVDDAFLSQLSAAIRSIVLAEMASGMAHELNQPLAAIATFSHAGERMLNRSEPMVERALDVFRQIGQEALGAGTRMQKIRNLFELDRSRHTRCRVADLIAQIQPVLMTAAEQHDVTLKFDVDGTYPDVQVDRLRIQGVLLALVQNAIEASAVHGGARVIRIDMVAERHEVETGIMDSGAGIPQDHADQMFRPFFTTKAHGTGLGLAASRATIEAHEGTMGFMNMSGGGTRFWFRLPIAVG